MMVARLTTQSDTPPGQLDSSNVSTEDSAVDLTVSPTSDVPDDQNSNGVQQNLTVNRNKSNRKANSLRN